MGFKSVNSFLTPEFDYNFLIGQLSDYKQPWDKIGELIKKEEIIRVKKGLYVLGPQYERPYSLFILANLIFGPSYVSKESALSYHGLIPEGVSLVSSVTPKRKKQFETTVGSFDYEYQAMKRFSVGFTRVSLDEYRSFLIATPEKALVDIMWRQKKLDDITSVRDYLLYELRIEEGSFRGFSLESIRMLKKLFDKPPIQNLLQLVEEYHNE